MPLDTIPQRIVDARERIAVACARSGRSPDDVTLIAVTKGFGPDAVIAVTAAGVGDIGEN